LIKIYTKTDCPYCVEAKKWLKSHNYSYVEILLDNNEERQQFYVSNNIRSRMVPQIFFNGVLIGGYSDLIHSELAIKNVNISQEDF